MIKFKLPELGEGIDTAEVLNVIVKEGDIVEEEQSLLELETEKAAFELPSPANGKIHEILVKNGETIKVGQVIVKIEEKDIPKKEKKQEGAETRKKELDVEEVIEKSNEKELRNNVTEIPVSKKKIEVVKEPEQADTKITELPKTNEIKLPVPASPSVRKLARELGIEISMVTGTGPSGRISSEDVKNFAKSSLRATTAKDTTNFIQPGLPDFSAWGEIEIEEMSSVRKITADHLSKSWHAPHVTQHDKADISELELLRKQYGESVKKEGGKLTMTAIIIKIVSAALKVFPKLNSSIDLNRQEIIYKKYINMGVAVDTERGLLVPVIKNVDKKNITDVSIELTDLSDRARNKKIKPDELQGGTFTVTNLGGFGGTYFTPVINFPEVAILGVSRSVFEPVYIKDKFEPRLMLPLSLSYDHRIIDGADAIKFLRWISEALEDPFKILLEGKSL